LSSFSGGTDLRQTAALDPIAALKLWLILAGAGLGPFCGGIGGLSAISWRSPHAEVLYPVGGTHRGECMIDFAQHACAAFKYAGDRDPTQAPIPNLSM